MSAKKIQYFDIKFPFTSNNNEGLFIDLNRSLNEKVASQIAHLILTRKGTRLRDPEFGTKLVEFIFNQNDDLSWSEVRNEITNSVSRFIPNATITDVSVIRDEGQDNTIMVDIQYSIKTGNKDEGYRMVLNI